MWACETRPGRKARFFCEAKLKAAEVPPRPAKGGPAEPPFSAPLLNAFPLRRGSGLRNRTLPEEMEIKQMGLDVIFLLTEARLTWKEATQSVQMERDEQTAQSGGERR